MSMQRGLIVSVALHSGVALAFAMGLTLRTKPIDQKMVEVPVEIVRFAPESNPPPGKKPVPREERKPDSDKSTADRAPSAVKRADRKVGRSETARKDAKPAPAPKAAETRKDPPKTAERSPDPKSVARPTPRKPDRPSETERKVASVRPPAAERKVEAKPKPKPTPTTPPKPVEKESDVKKTEENPKAKKVAQSENQPKKADKNTPVKKAAEKPKPKTVKKAEAKPKSVKKLKKPAAKKAPAKRQVAAARPKAKAGAPKRAPKPKAGTNFDSILKSVDNMRTKRDDNRNRTRAQAPRGSQDHVRSRPLTISEIDAVRRQIRPCWNFPSGAKNARQLRVQVRMWMNRDGTVRKAQILEARRMRSDSFFRAAALAAYRAVKNPRCGPLKLPREKYDRWKVMVIEFDPSEMGDGL